MGTWRLRVQNLDSSPAFCSQAAAHPNNGDFLLHRSATLPLRALRFRSAALTAHRLLHRRNSDRHPNGPNRTRCDSDETGRAPGSMPRPGDEQRVGVGEL